MSTLPALDLSCGITPRPRGISIPLTAMQRRIFESAKRGGLLSTRLYTSSTFHLSGKLDIDLLRLSLEAIVQRHEVLRTRFVSYDEAHAIQQVDESISFFDIDDLCAPSSKLSIEEACSTATDFMSTEVHLSVGPLFAARLLRFGQDEYLLVLALEHMISDAISGQLLFRELGQHYQGLANGLPPSAPPSIQFADYALWQERTYDSWLRRHQRYWEQKLSAAPKNKLPEAGVCAPVPSHEVIARPFSKSSTIRLEALSRDQRVPISIVILALYVVVMSRWCNERALLVGVVHHGRDRPELQEMIGFLATILYLKIELASQHRFVDLLQRVFSEFNTSWLHLDYDRVPDLFPDLSTQLYFNWLPVGWLDRQSPHPFGAHPELRAQRISTHRAWPSRFGCFFFYHDKTIHVRIHFSTAAFSLGAMNDLCDSFRTCAEALAINALIPIESLPLARL